MNPNTPAAVHGTDAGSRLNDTACGGDVGPLVAAPGMPPLQQHVLAMMELEGVLQLPVDILAVKRGEEGSTFVQAVRPRILPLEATA